VTATNKRFSVYVIGLDETVLQHKKFLEANPGYKPGKSCVYVGMTARTPQERFQQHKSGYKSGKFVKRYGLHLRKRLYEKYNPLTYEEAQKLEVALARKLREKGYAVWQN
jgi:hypothetical protein